MPPKDTTLQVLLFGNGGCRSSGSAFTNLLTEIASHGYLAIANGPPEAFPKSGRFDIASVFRGKGKEGKSEEEVSSKFQPELEKSGIQRRQAPGKGPRLAGLEGRMRSSVKQLTDAMDWVVKDGAAKYRDIDTKKIAASGQSCGGFQAYSASYCDDRIMLTIPFNSGVIEDSKACLLKELKFPIAYFIGRPKDIAYNNAELDCVTIPQHLPDLKMNLDAGRIGTFYAPSPGKFGNAAVAFLSWVFKGDS